MKKALALAGAMTLAAGSVLAVPYASLIRVSDNTLLVGQGGTITYVLNESADTVTIEILDGTSTVVATFAGTTDQGVNSVAWDGTDDNSGGTEIGDGTGFTIRITADKTAAAAWELIAINQSDTIGDTFYTTAPLDAINHKSLWTRFRPHSVLVPKDTDSDDFGKILMPVSDTIGSSPDNPVAAVAVLNADLSVPANSSLQGYDTRVLRHPQSDGGTETTGFQDVWAIAADPVNPGYYFVSGQATAPRTQLSYGSLSDNIAADANTGALDLGAPRTTAVLDESGTRVLFQAAGTDTVNMYTVDGSNQLVGPAVDIIGITDGLYSKHVFLDSDGNLYWLSRATGTTADTGRVYRWPASLINSSLAADALTAANADSVVTIASGGNLGLLGELAELPNGDIIVAAGGNTTDLYLINLGNKADSSLTQEIASTDAFFSLTGLASTINTYAVGIDTDPFGNIYYASANSLFGAWVISPGGNTSIAIEAPASQAFEMQTEPTAARGWNLYE